MKKFKRYKRIKKEVSYNYHGYPIEKILAIDIAVWVYNKRNFTLKTYLSYIKHVIPYFVRSLNLDGLKLNEPQKTLFSMGQFKRADYYEIWEDVKERVDQKISFDFSKQEFRFRFDLKKIVLACFIISRAKRLELIARIMLAGRVTYYLNIIDELEKINPIAGKYCSFSSEHDVETILTRYFQKKEIKTYSLQHGIDFIHRKRIELSSILYENFMTDFRMLWGKFTKDEFVEYGVDENSLIVAGYPRKINRPKIPEKINKKECLVFLGSYPYHDANIHLINVLKKWEEAVNFEFKLHPRSERSKYEKIILENGWSLMDENQTLTDLFESNKYGWAIVVNSSAYYESYLYYIPCLRFNDGSFLDLADVKDDKFSNIQELKRCLDSIPFEEPEKIPAYFDEADQNLEYVIGIHKDEYHLLNCDS